MGKSCLSNPFKINVFKTHSLKIFNLAQQNLTKLLCRDCANIRKAYVGYVAIYAFFYLIISIICDMTYLGIDFKSFTHKIGHVISSLST